ncbi:MAG: hypothetical protein DRQ88_06935 [Epsilonproteobacteria bacterium]|nr:MAG: hypothetical protein DRQ89_05655 [Campylobacterota bacterium]RLA66370.1 MAG: hypothetical protein DRQ88_06935 [Campylobacterota bacterium]
MSKNWVVVAGRSEAKIFELNRKGPKLTLLKTIEQPEGKMRNEELDSDRPGVTKSRYKGSANTSSLTKSQNTKEHNAEIFGKHIVHELDKARKGNQCDNVIFIVESSFKGILNKNLKRNGMKNIVYDIVNKNYINLKKDEISDRLKDLFLASFAA